MLCGLYGASPCAESVSIRDLGVQTLEQEHEEEPEQQSYDYEYRSIHGQLRKPDE